MMAHTHDTNRFAGRLAVDAGASVGSHHRPAGGGPETAVAIAQRTKMVYGVGQVGKWGE